MTRWERLLARVGLFREMPVLQAVIVPTATSTFPEQEAVANAILAQIQESDDPATQALRELLGAIAARPVTIPGADVNG